MNSFRWSSNSIGFYDFFNPLTLACQLQCTFWFVIISALNPPSHTVSVSHLFAMRHLAPSLKQSTRLFFYAWPGRNWFAIKFNIACSPLKFKRGMNAAVKREKGEFGFVLFFIAKKRTKKV